MTETLALDRLMSRVADGALVALPPDYSFVPMAAVRALVRRGVRGLHLVTVPQAGMRGGPPDRRRLRRFHRDRGGEPRRARQRTPLCRRVEGGHLAIRDSTCPAIHAALQAAEKGVPFMPLRGLIGSDLLRVRPDWQVIDNPLRRATPSSCCRR